MIKLHSGLAGQDGQQVKVNRLSTAGILKEDSVVAEVMNLVRVLDFLHQIAEHLRRIGVQLVEAKGGA